MLFVLPADPKSGNDDTRGVLAELIEADEDAGRILACTLYARSGPRADPIYVHAKIAIVDDRWLTLGSANLNEHSLFNDTEMKRRRSRLRARAPDAAAPVGGAPRTARRRDPRRPDAGDRRAVAADQQGAAGTALQRPAAHASARASAAGVETNPTDPRPDQQPGRRRLRRHEAPRPVAAALVIAGCNGLPPVAPAWLDNCSMADARRACG
jgi:hypothetical protein